MPPQLTRPQCGCALGWRVESPDPEDWIDYDEQLVWMDDQHLELTEISDETNSMFSMAFTHCVNNAMR